MKKRYLVIIALLLILISACSSPKGVESFTYTGVNGDWSVNIPSSFAKYSEEKHDGFIMTSYMDDKGRRLSISEFADKDTIIDENFFINEVGEDSYFQQEENMVIENESIGKIYGVIGEDHSTESFFMYYKARINENVVSLVVFKDKEFTDKEIEEIKGIVSNMKKL